MNNFRTIQKQLARWFAIPWYPLVFSMYPVLTLLATNVGQVKVSAGQRILVLSILFAAVLMGLARIFLKSWQNAAFLTALLLALFFSYGHVQILLAQKFPKIDWTRYLLWGWLALAIIAVILAVKVAPAPLILNVIALGLVIMSVGQISSDVPKGSVNRLPEKNPPVGDLVRPENPPDVYYFILDMYTRSDLLQAAYGYDNSEFLNGLKDRGFYVAQCSQSNYPRTELSVTSSLNFSYLQDLDPEFNDPKSIARLHLWDSLKHNTARYELENMGYKTISFANGFAWSELDDANLFLTPPPFSSSMTEFETLFMHTTLARTFEDFGWLNLDEINAQNFRDRDLLVFNSLKRIAGMSGPKFVYVHLIMPHPPFVFGPNGEHANPADYWNEQKLYPADKFGRGYTGQMTFLNHKILEAIDAIQAESKTPPVIVLQGDHGPWLQPNPQHFFILNAYYLPNHNEQLYSHISPVNTFRMIFNSYFGGKYDMLPDITYYSPVPDLYDYSVVDNPCK